MFNQLRKKNKETEVKLSKEIRNNLGKKMDFDKKR